MVSLRAREVLTNQMLRNMELRVAARLTEALGIVATLQAVSLSVCQSVSCPVARTA